MATVKINCFSAWVTKHCLGLFIINESKICSVVSSFLMQSQTSYRKAKSFIPCHFIKLVERSEVAPSINFSDLFRFQTSNLLTADLVLKIQNGRFKTKYVTTAGKICLLLSLKSDLRVPVKWPPIHLASPFLPRWDFGRFMESLAISDHG